MPRKAAKKRLSESVESSPKESARSLRRRLRNEKINMPKSNPFLKSTYEMINSCDPSIASWTEEGDMIEIKDQVRFEEEVIPKFFNHNKFSSFARQLNFYGFSKIPSRDLRREDDDSNTPPSSPSPAVVTFHNEYFKRDDPDLMRNIKRSTKHTGGSNPPNDQQAEIEGLKHQISVMQGDMEDMEKQFGAHIVRMEEDFQRRIEQMTKDFAAGKAQSNRPNPSPKQPVGGFKQFEQPWENRRMEVESVKIEKNVKKNP